MRLRHPDGSTVHLAYCTNVHPAEDLDGVIAQLARFAEPVRRSLDSDLLGVGLWLAQPLAARLAAEPRDVARLRAELDTRGLEVVTFNGFPYSGFQRGEVKKQVYRPDWSEADRLRYTTDLATVLAQLLPDDVARGSISTVPLGWRKGWYHDRDTTANARLAELGDFLDGLADRTGRSVRVGIEPEPGCLVETTEQAVQRVVDVAHPRVGMCLDTCHLAVAFEDPVVAVQHIRDAGVPVVKMQASAALHVPAPKEARHREAVAAFDERRFLHQVRELAGGRVFTRDDLGDALGGSRPLPGRGPWRVHFHVPVHTDPAPPLQSTRAHLEETLAAALGGGAPLTDHVEAETYTWGVLPAGHAPTTDDELVAGLAAEVGWVRDRLVGQRMECAA